MGFIFKENELKNDVLCKWQLYLLRESFTLMYLANN